MRKSLPMLLLIMALAACTKEEEVVAPNPSKTDLLTAKSWRLTALTSLAITNGFGTTTDHYATQASCTRDDFMSFKRDKSVVFDEGSITCFPNAPQTTTSQWEWQDNETVLAYVTSNGFTGTVKCELLELTATTLRLRLLQRLGSDTFTQEWTYQAI
jgi:hypothetical protein